MDVIKITHIINYSGKTLGKTAATVHMYGAVFCLQYSP